MIKKIMKTSDLYDAIYEAVLKIYNCEIELDDPTTTTNEVVREINNYLSKGRDK